MVVSGTDIGHSGTGAPEAVLDWGGGGKDLRGLTIFPVGAHQWRSQLFGMGGGQGYQMYRQKKN